MTLKGKVALVTGAAKRVGRAIALDLAKRGAHLVIHYNTSRREGEATAAAVRRLRRRALTVQADLTDDDAVRQMVATARRTFGRVDVLVNSAAIFPKTPFATLSESDWDTAIDANLKGPFLCALHIGRAMRSSGCGKIINIADWAGIRPYRDYLPYCVAKAGVIALTKALAKELAPKVQVNCIAPGPVLWPEDFSAAERQQIIRRTPLRRAGSPADIAETVAFLIEGSDFITGATIPVEGGRLLA